MPSTQYIKQVSVIVGTNVIKSTKPCTLKNSKWKAPFMSIEEDYVCTVRSTNKSPIEIQPFETITVSGLVRKQEHVEFAVTEPTDRTSSKLGICPRIVALYKSGKNERVPIRTFNISVKILTLQPCHFFVKYMRLRCLDLEHLKKSQTLLQVLKSTANAQADLHLCY